MQRTVNDLVNEVAVNSGVEPFKILRTVRVNQKGLTVLFDDEIVTHLLEGQDMIAEFHESKSQALNAWDAGLTKFQINYGLDVVETVQPESFELRLLF
jgi:hypothetical protein